MHLREDEKEANMTFTFLMHFEAAPRPAAPAARPTKQVI